MRQTALLCLCALLVAGLGCGQRPDGHVEATPSTVVAEGVQSIPPRGDATVEIPATGGSGNLTAKLMWPGAESRVTAYFQNGTPGNHGWARSRSPLVSKVEVTEAQAADGENWKLNIANTSCCSAVTVRYAVTFTPDEE